MRFTIKVFLLLLILIGGVAAIAIYTTFYAPLPDYDQTHRVEGINSAVKIHWDPYGVPYITADNEDDLYFAMGYVHAQERLWQMTLLQLRAEGRFAEFLGEDFVETDRYLRTLGFWETAKKIEENTPDSLQRLLQKYADGVNRYVEMNERRLPPQFVLLDADPIEWTPRHSIAATRLIAWDANIHKYAELTFADLSSRLNSYQFQQLVPDYQDGLLSDHHEDEELMPNLNIHAYLQAGKNLRQKLGSSIAASGSNALALSGEKTISGEPMLAGDIHSSLSIPGPWFDVTHSLPDFNISGATYPGIPFLLMGQSERHAWATTSLYADDTDFFLERISDGDTESYLADNTADTSTAVPFQKRREIIHIKNADDRLHVVRSTHNGPVISDVTFAESSEEETLITLKWTGHEISHELLALYEMNRAKSMDQFRKAVEYFKTPGTNFIYADTSNNVALFTAVSAPIRSGNPLTFREGWNPEHEWNGYLPFNQLPHIINPESGIVAHANNRHFDEDYPHYIGSFWEPSSRIRRITELLNSEDRLDTEAVQELQFDVVSEHARDITELILPMLRSGEQSEGMAIAVNYLENWNFRYEPASTAASLFDLFMMRLSENTILDDVGEEAFQNILEIRHLPPAILLRMLNENSLMFDNSDTDETETREQIVRRSMLRAVDDLKNMFGDEPFGWRWENAVSFHLTPPLLAELAGDTVSSSAVLGPVIRNLFSQGPYTVRGNPMTINKVQYSWEFPFVMKEGASIRRIVDLSNPSRSFTVLPTGQSGNPLSEFYGNQTDLWLEGRYRYIYRDSSFFDQTSYQITTLLPVQN